MGKIFISVIFPWLFIFGFSVLREENYNLYDSLIINNYWKVKSFDNCYYSNFAYPIITPNINELVEELLLNKVECRPLVCGSIGLQPFWKKLYGEQKFDFADKVHNYGLYLPNNQDITKDEIIFISNIVNKYTKV